MYVKALEETEKGKKGKKESKKKGNDTMEKGNGGD
jgi:hypothetical protein